MKYVITYILEKGICTVDVTGEVRRPDDSIELQKLSWRYSRENGCCKFIFDMRAATVIGGASAIHEVAEAPSTEGVDPDGFHIALVYAAIDTATLGMQYLLETRGFDVRVFDCLDAANLWIEQR